MSVEITVMSKLYDWRKPSPQVWRLWAMFFIGTVLVVLSYFLIDSNSIGRLFTSLVVLAGVISVIAWIVWPPKQMKLVIDDKSISVDNMHWAHGTVKGWALAEIYGATEIVFWRGGGERIYVYAHPEDLLDSGAVNYLREHIPYSEDLLKEDTVSMIFRTLGLR
jgi:hypothetical protein